MISRKVSVIRTVLAAIVIVAISAPYANTVTCAIADDVMMEHAGAMDDMCFVASHDTTCLDLACCTGVTVAPALSGATAISPAWHVTVLPPPLVHLATRSASPLTPPPKA